MGIRKWWKQGLFALGLLAAWASGSLYRVEQSDFTLVSRFGEPRHAWDGANDSGLHLKCPWPIDTITRYDRRLQILEVPMVESLTRDVANQTVDKTLGVDAVVYWQISDPLLFQKSVGSLAQAERLLAPRFASRLGAIVGSLPMEQLIQVVPMAEQEQRAEKFREWLLRRTPINNQDTGEPLTQAIERELGVRIVDARLRRLQYPEAVRGSIAERIRSERNRKVAEYQAEGDRKYREIVAAAERDAKGILAEAQALKAKKEAEAEVQAERIRNEAYAKDPDFFTFLQKIRAYQTMVSETRDILLLSTRHELFDLLLKPPAATTTPTPPAPAPAAPSTPKQEK